MAELERSPLSAGEDNISVDAARAAIRAALTPIAGTETVPLVAARGRVLAADVISPIDVPAHDNSAMDGYAFDGAALRDGVALELRSVGTIHAGHAPAGPLAAGECVRIMTGAVMPAGLDTVVPLELCRVDGDMVRIAPGVIRAGENRRRRGEDLTAGRPAIAAGRVLRPADIGLVASLGLTEIEVRRRLRVAVFSTGDEVVAPGQPLPPHCIYDSNRYALLAAIERLGMEAIDLGLLRDDPVMLEAALRDAANRADAIVTSGGVSAGDADYTRDIIERLGEVQFWKVAMRPGRPFAFGVLHGDDGAHAAFLFALPGNPVASLVTFYVFAREALLVLAGAEPEPIPVLQARSVAALRKRPGRSEFQRARVSRADDGIWEVRTVGSQGAGILRSMSEANALIVLGYGQGSVAAGSPVDVWLFDGWT
ncbi:MAG: molybdopterin molybdotransferase MoeA [Proteobacteria bacterium]|nr:molybdopterin molybdotransferase MoeA [Pseudomonadota bacterium]